MGTKITWKSQPDEHDFPAALAFLELVLPVDVAATVTAALRTAPAEMRKSKDLIRASGLPSLDRTNAHVARDIEKIHSGVPLSPVLVVRGDANQRRPLIIADGYHRICAVHQVDEDVEIHCRIAEFPSSSTAHR